METSRLIEQLAADNAPVQCLRCPSRRAAIWLALAAPYVALIVLLMSLRHDLATVAGDPWFLIEQTATLATATAAAYAAFAITVPGYDRRILLLPAAGFVFWVGTLCLGSFAELMRDGTTVLSSHHDWFCVRWIMTVGFVPAIIMAVMLRRGAPMAPYSAAALGGLAAAAIGNFGLRLFNPEEVGVLMLFWHTGALVTVSLIAGWLGRMFMTWHSATAPLRRTIAAG